MVSIYKDPEGDKIFENIYSVGISKESEHEGEVLSLQRRIKELEEKNNVCNLAIANLAS